MCLFKLAIQILGGYGYTREYPVERLYRDNRLNHIHEGAWANNGIDILGRKVSMYDGAAVTVFKAQIQQTSLQAIAFPQLKAYKQQLNDSLQLIDSTIAAVADCPDKAQALANATLFLDAFGYVVVAWMWLKQAIAAQQGLAKGDKSDKYFFQGKLAATQFFYRYELPKIKAALSLVEDLDSTCYDLKIEELTGH